MSLALFGLLIFFKVSTTLGELSLAQKQELLDWHNIVRARLCNGLDPKQPKCANVCVMKWDDRLAAKAQEWSEHCVAEHDSNANRDFEPYVTTSVGQNAAFGFASMNESIVNWYRELDYYDFKTTQCQNGKICGHYTQLMQFDSILVGCGFHKCNNAYKDSLFCNYAPGGNKGEGQAVYYPGEPCSNCPVEFGFCMNGLCAKKEYCTDGKCTCPLTSSSCKNGGTFNADTCRCECKSGFEGSTCADECKDVFSWCFLSMCSPQSGGYSDALSGCRRTCGFCNKKVFPDDPFKEDRNRLSIRVPPVEQLKTLGTLESILHKNPPPNPQPEAELEFQEYYEYYYK